MFPQDFPAIPAGGSRLCVGQLPPAQDQAFYAGFSDGSVKKGLATCAFALYGPNHQPLSRQAHQLPLPTRDSNVPELQGLLELLEEATRQGARRLVAFIDSYQVVEALLRRQAGRLASRYASLEVVWALFENFDYVEVRNIANRLNKEADALCTSARR